MSSSRKRIDRRTAFALLAAGLLVGLVILADPPRAQESAVDGGWTPPSPGTPGAVVWTPVDEAPVTLEGEEAPRWQGVRAALEGALHAVDPDAVVRWVPAFQWKGPRLEEALRTMAHRHPTVTVWRGDFAHGAACLALVGQRRGARMDVEGLGRAFAAPTAVDDEPPGRPAAATLPLLLYAGNAGAWLATSPPSLDAELLAGDALLAFEAALQEQVPPAQDPYLEAVSPASRRRVAAGLALRRLAVHLAALRPDEQRAALRDYVRGTLGVDRPEPHEWVR